MLTATGETWTSRFMSWRLRLLFFPKRQGRSLNVYGSIAPSSDCDADTFAT